ncbi:hypothetical protein JTE90_007223 [Oedothorax gibbosus]|uniref:Uncharacterized protein n=1 Tax=Oedothorax gibbosus TaxID=931172 RepID=A0AAV6VNK0_9ARAC|nr:hypothetical protein JTE90_007223 [Oedothorax gibbosus]
MKAALVLVILTSLVAVTLSATRCQRQSDCEADECCLDTLFFRSAFCEKRYQPDKSCPTASVYKPENDIYYLSCPCVDKYECLGKGTLEDGVTVVKEAKCIMPTV